MELCLSNMYAYSSYNKCISTAIWNGSVKCLVSCHSRESRAAEWFSGAFKKFQPGSGRVPPLPKCNMHLSRIYKLLKASPSHRGIKKCSSHLYPGRLIFRAASSPARVKVAWEMTDALFTRQSWASEGSGGFSSAQLLRCDERRNLGFPPSRHSTATFFAGCSINCTRGRFWCVCDVQSWKWRQPAYWLINRVPFCRCVNNHNRESGWIELCINAPTQQAKCDGAGLSGKRFVLCARGSGLRRFDIQASKQTHWSHSHLIRQIQW